MYESGDKKVEDLDPPPKGPTLGSSYRMIGSSYRTICKDVVVTDYKLFKLLQAVELVIEDGRVADMYEDDPNVEELVYCWNQFSGTESADK